MPLFDAKDHVYLGILGWLRNGMIDADLLDMEGCRAIGVNKGIRIRGRNVDLLTLTYRGNQRNRSEGYNKRRVYRDLSFEYRVKDCATVSPTEAMATLELRRKGSLSREVIGGEWKGGALADRLNCDPQLISRLLSHNILHMAVVPNRRGGPPVIEHMSTIEILETSSFFGGTESRIEKLPSLDLFGTVDEIAERIKSL